MQGYEPVLKLQGSTQGSIKNPAGYPHSEKKPPARVKTLLLPGPPFYQRLFIKNGNYKTNLNLSFAKMA
jgi:hypothetical protein